MNKRLTIPLCFIIILLFNNCKEVSKQAEQTPSAEIRGQIFIIQKNRVNVKLGGVEIYFIPLQQFRDRAAWIAKNQETSKYILAYERKLEQVDSFIENLTSKPFARHFQGFISDARRIQDENRRKFKENPLVAEFQNMAEIQVENAEIFDSSEFRGLPEMQWCLMAIMSKWLDQTKTAQTSTDADGNYSLVVPKGAGGYIVAQASRNLLGDDVEHYFWMQEVSGLETAPVHLNSSNLLDPSTFSGMLKSTAPPFRTSMKIVEDEFNLASLEWFDEAGYLVRKATAHQNKIDVLKLQVDQLEEEIEATKSMSEP